MRYITLSVLPTSELPMLLPVSFAVVDPIIRIPQLRCVLDGSPAVVIGWSCWHGGEETDVRIARQPNLSELLVWGGDMGLKIFTGREIATMQQAKSKQFLLLPKRDCCSTVLAHFACTSALATE